MPPPQTPPQLAMPETIFDDLNAMSYDATNQGFLDGNNALQYLFVEVDSNGYARWTYTASTSTVVNLAARVTQLTADVIIGGSYQSQSGAINYNNQNYKIRLERDSNGVAIAHAHTV